MSSTRKNILFLASGRGSNFQSFVDHANLNILQNVELKGLVCNHGGQAVLERAKRANIPTFEIEGVSKKHFDSQNQRDQARLAFDKECLSISKTLSIDYVILAGFDQILTKTFTDNFPFRILNIHPAYDLKRFGGKNMVGEKVHEAVISSEMDYSGCTVHFVVSAVDQGPAVLKRRVNVESEDTPEKLGKRILEQEHIVFPRALQLLVDGRVLVSESGNACYVDEYSDNWDISWDSRQRAYFEYLRARGEE